MLASESISGIAPPFRPRRFTADASYVVVDGDSGEPGGKDPSSPRVDFGLGDDSHPGSFESEVESSDR
jgi:hypothetical protein